MKARNQIRNTLADFTVLWQDSQKQSPEVFYKKVILIKFIISTETPVLEPLFISVAGLKAYNFIKKRPQHRCFPVNIAKFLILFISKNISERLLFYFFYGSRLHGPKASRSRLYDGVRLQGLSHGTSFLFLSWHEPSPSHGPGFENLRRMLLISQLGFYIG